VTVPVPFPASAIVSVAGGEADGNVAVTVVSQFISTTQVPVPEQPLPLQPVNPVPVAVNVTLVPVGTTVEQVPAPRTQLIPAGVDVTMPLLTTVTVNSLSDA
jgi:hypothetical protein